MTEPADKRAEKRVSFPCEVDCAGLGVGSSSTSPRISDLSLGGAFVDSAATVPPGTRFRMRFALPSLVVDCEAEVVHEMAQFGMGVRFLDLTALQRVAIEEVVAAR